MENLPLLCLSQFANDNGTGMHINMSIWNNNTPVFSGKEYSGLSRTLFIILGNIKAR